MTRRRPLPGEAGSQLAWLGAVAAVLLAMTGALCGCSWLGPAAAAAAPALIELTEEAIRAELDRASGPRAEQLQWVLHLLEERRAAEEQRCVAAEEARAAAQRAEDAAREAARAAQDARDARQEAREAAALAQASQRLAEAAQEATAAATREAIVRQRVHDLGLLLEAVRPVVVGQGSAAPADTEAP